MTTFKDSVGVVHALTYVNKERRAGATACKNLVEFRPRHVEDRVVTCVRCLGEIQCDCDKVRAKFALPWSRSVGHELGCVSHWGRDMVDGRREDVVRRCRDAGSHYRSCDDDGYCNSCGYQDLEDDE